MGLLNEVLAVDAATFTNSDDFGESVIYTPVSGSPRTIYANVDREPPELMRADGTAWIPKMLITVANSATTGISATEIDNGGDTVTVAYPLGASAAAYAIFGTPLTQDGGMIRLALD